MTTWLTCAALRRSARLGLAGLMIVTAVRGAAASDDAGVQGFFSAIFGGASAQSPDVGPSVPDASEQTLPRHRRARSLTVHLHRGEPRIIASQGPTKTVKVSIFEDRTLKRGDAVMTAQGVRIFAGSTSWPYTPEDFVGLSDARHLDKGTADVFAALDRLPRS